MEDAQNFVDLADLHEHYVCGVLGRHLAGFCMLKSGRRRVLQCQDHGNICRDDIDLVRMSEFGAGMFLICPQKILTKFIIV